MASFVGAKGVRISQAKRRGRRGPGDVRGNAYHQRTQVLWKMGFIDYRAYLKSDLWKSIREKVRSVKPACEICGHPTTCVHHLSYSLRILRGDLLNQLVALCNDCHKRCEFDDNGRKRSFHRTNRMTKKLLKRSGAWGVTSGNVGLLKTQE